ncbi:hypothetical protein LTR62_003253 [Meristemomyces frigidus]|uniref:WD40 repeat-like protein n=1 Tax=Meristemomyces frigidus TaxID=1508187 RepID=A0AAN7TF51_9PEZI|nr:hypothetical protein LTR62_003253 [Meristemomyces frigidus]
MLEDVEKLVPVTALAFLQDDVILTGKGQYVHAYNATTTRRLAETCVFDSTAVHGLVVDEETGEAIVWGGDLVKLLQYVRDEESNHRLESFPARQIADWIMDGALSPPSGDSTRYLALVTAHNALLVTTLAELASAETVQSIEPVVPGSNCILYSAHIHWLNASQCLIASGTAFGDVILWSADLHVSSDGTLTAEARTHYTFAAQDGSVFGVQISEPRTLGSRGEHKRLLATCSDDRTVRLWDVTDLASQSFRLTELHRDTGFGEKNGTVEHAPRCLAKAMGHGSRIWHVRFLRATAGETMQLLSLGEDASQISWILSPTDDSEQYRLQRTIVQTAHAGKHIWSVAVGTDGRIATGGADGAIAIHIAKTVATEPNELSGQLLANGQSTDKFKAYGFIGHDSILATTESGRVVTLDKVPNRNVQLNEVASCKPNLRGYSLVATVPGFAWISGASGALYMYTDDRKLLVELYSIGIKTAGLFAQHDKKHDISLLVTNVGGLTAALLDLTPHMSPIIKFERSLALRKGFVVTSYTRANINDKNFALLGARDGTIAIYALDDNSEHSGSPHASVSLLPDTHGKEAVTSLLWISNTLSAPPCGFLHSTGRDGKHATHCISLVNNAVVVILVHQLNLPFGPNIEHIGKQDDGTLLAWGFRSKYFTAYNIGAQREVMIVECGGAHRTFAFQPSEGGGTLVWTKASSVYQQSQKQQLYSLINPGGHGREIKAVAISLSDSQIIATGAEDTNIKLWQYSNFTGFRCLQTLRKHNTGIQHLQWSQEARYLFSSGGFEEFFVWRITADVPIIDLGVVCESAHPRSGKSDLRIMAFDVQEASTGGHVEKESFVIAMAYSDSTLKQWRYTRSGCLWQLSASTDYLTACLSQAVSLRPSGHHFLTASTDGHLALWDHLSADRPLVWNRRQKVHQNAILSLLACDLPDQSRLVFTGGDDNAIGITRLTTFGQTHTLLLPRAHAAAVTGLAFMESDSGRGRWTIASASIDQRVKVWDVEIDGDCQGVEGVEVKLRGNVHTAVADVSGLEMLRLDDGGLGVLVVGVGLDLLRAT